ncbi:unnamed protein product [Symbiodinium pilosum]|uniref:Tubulin beta chain n=1 Tax=Symbiodinium pilosum TaxID=2952 RepID=A0A812VFZ9_SYMPI|nr:unnamed protein product [Symbiodinium pilosum]
MQPENSKHASSGREIIHIQVGKAGNAIGNQFWKALCEEHGLNTQKDDNMKGCLMDDGEGQGPKGYIDVFFNEGRSMEGKTRYVPRAILLDTNMGDLATIAEDSAVGDLYRPEDIIGNDESSGNCYAKAFHTEGPDLADRCLEMVRKEVEKCNCLQGVQFCHAAIGGTGTGLTGLVLKTLRDYLDKQSRAVMQSFVLAPAPGISDVVLEPYNACLCFQDLLEYTDQVFLFDNKALSEICQKALEQDMPKMADLNDVIVRCMSGITSCLRYTGPLNADLRKLQTNLVPFKNAHFLINGLAPLNSKAAEKYRKASVLDLTQQMLSKDNVTVKCDPLNPGDEFHGMLKARFLASWTSWKGKFPTKEVDKALHDIQKDGSRYDKFFPDWIPNSIASNISGAKQKSQEQRNVVFTTNNTAVHEVFDRSIKAWDNTYKSRAFVHVFEQDGISVQDLMESRNIVQYISDAYCEFGRWEDKFFEDISGGGKPVVKERAIDNDEQRNIAQELKELWQGEMYIKVDPLGRGAGQTV